MDYTKMKGCHPGSDPVGLKGPDGMNTLSSYQAGREDTITLIRAEIERRIHRLRSSIQSQGDYGQSCQIVAYEHLLSFLDTLQEQEVKEQKSQDTVGRVSIEIRSNLQTDEVVRKTLIMLVNDGRISVTGAITSSDILAFLAGAEWKDRSLNWIRDLVKAAIKKPDEAQGILERIDRMLNKEEEQ